MFRFFHVENSAQPEVLHHSSKFSSSWCWSLAVRVLGAVAVRGVQAALQPGCYLYALAPSALVKISPAFFHPQLLPYCFVEETTSYQFVRVSPEMSSRSTPAAILSALGLPAELLAQLSEVCFRHRRSYHRHISLFTRWESTSMILYWKPSTVTFSNSLSMLRDFPIHFDSL